MDDTPIDEEATRRRLDAEREKLQGLVAGLRTETTQGEVTASETARGEVPVPPAGEQGSYDQQPGEVSGETFEREKDLAILESLEVELAEIEAALRRLDEGTYGIDEVTGEPIDRARLDARPGARTNVDTDHD